MIRRTAWTRGIASIALAALLTGCAATAGLATPAAPIGPTEVRSRPIWIDHPPEAVGGTRIFVGWSNPQSDEASARDRAFRNALQHYAVFIGVELTNRELLSVRADSLNDTSSLEGRSRMRLGAVLGGFRADEWFVEERQDRFEAWVKCHVTDDEIAAAREFFLARPLSQSRLVAVSIEGDPQGIVRDRLAVALTRAGFSTTDLPPLEQTSWILRGRYSAEPRPAPERGERRVLVYSSLVLEFVKPGSQEIALAFDKSAMGLGFDLREATANAADRQIDTERFRDYLDEMKWEAGLP